AAWTQRHVPLDSNYRGGELFRRLGGRIGGADRRLEESRGFPRQTGPHASLANPCPTINAGATVVIIQVRSNRPTQRRFVEDDHVIEAFAADRTDHTFNIGALPGRSRRGKDLSNIHRPKLLLKGKAVNSITITQQIPRRGIEGK